MSQISNSTLITLTTYIWRVGSLLIHLTPRYTYKMDQLHFPVEALFNFHYEYILYFQSYLRLSIPVSYFFYLWESSSSNTMRYLQGIDSWFRWTYFSKRNSKGSCVFQVCQKGQGETEICCLAKTRGRWGAQKQGKSRRAERILLGFSWTLTSLHVGWGTRVGFGSDRPERKREKQQIDVVSL